MQPGVIWIGPHSRVAFFPAGSDADVDTSVHDTLRYAREIQTLRDAKDFSGADARRVIVEGVGGQVRNIRCGTVVVEASKYDVCRKHPIPDWMGASSWVRPDEVGDRKVVETCYNQDGSVHSVLVMNWADHPNLETARSMGLPDALWTESGQHNITLSGDAMWFLEQMAAIDRCIMGQIVSAAINELVKEL